MAARMRARDKRASRNRGAGAGAGAVAAVGRADAGRGHRPGVSPAPSQPGIARLWAPWRMSYIEPTAAGASDTPSGDTNAQYAAKTACLFCRVGASSGERRNLVLERRPHALLMLNRYPYNPGHLMVAVLEHKARFEALTSPERRDLIDLIALAERALALEYRPHGVNYGANAGRVAGAGFPGHLHVHLVPRWEGDTNFMPVVAEVKVLPESLEQTWSRLRRAIRRVRRATTSERHGA